MVARPTPYDLVFADAADEPFGRIRAALRERGGDPTDRDTFLMTRDAVELIRNLRPDEGMGEAIGQLAALVHHAYLFWDAGQHVGDISTDQLPQLMAADRAEDDERRTRRSAGADAIADAVYVQFPEHRLWAAAASGEPAEPLDGCFLHGHRAGRELRVLGIFGMRPDRMGFTVVEAAGGRPATLVRVDGSPAFSSTLPGGAAAGLHSLIGTEELLELGWRLWTA